MWKKSTNFGGYVTVREKKEEKVNKFNIILDISMNWIGGEKYED